MKKFFHCITLLCFVVTLFHSAIIAQEGQTPESYLTLAQAHEKVKAWKLAGDNYMLAGKAFEEKAKTYTTDAPIKSNLTAARDAYAKARDNYRNAKETEKEKEALQQAVRVGLLLGQKNAEEKSKEREETKAAIKQLPWKPGKEIILDARETNFSITMPEGIKFTGPKVHTKATHGMLRESETMVSVIGVNADPRFSFTLMEYIDGAGKESMSEYCDRQAKLYNEAEKKPLVGALIGKNVVVKEIDIGGGVKACLVTKETQQIDTKKYMFGFEMVFNLQKHSYGLTGSGPFAWRDAINEMLKTFRIVGEETASKPCNPSEIYLLENLAFEKVYKLPDETKDMRIVIEPYLSRNKVSDGWHLITQSLMDVLSAYQDLSDKFDLLINGKKAFHGKPGEFNDWVKMEIIMRVPNLPDISPASVINGYIDVFDKTISAISGLEGRISNMNVNLSWEVPYVNVTTKCIPQFICVNGKMEPDRKNLSYKLVSRGTQRDMQFYQNLTPAQAAEKREKVLNRFLEEIKKDAAAYPRAADCADFTHRLYNVKFPVAPDECARRQDVVSKLEAEQKTLEARKINLNKRINTHNATRQARIDERNKKILANNTSIAQKKKTRSQKEELKRNYENSSAPNRETLIRQVQEQIDNLTIQIGNLESENIVLMRERDDLTSNKFEKELKQEIQLIDERMKTLKEELTAAQKALDSCR